jgi:hypothetical protein
MGTGVTRPVEFIVKNISISIKFINAEEVSVIDKLIGL